VAAVPSLAIGQIQPIVPVPAPPVAPNAQETPAISLDRGLSVVDRTRPEYDPLGIRLGDFFLFPRFEVDESFNDNIFASNVGEQSDFITALAPSFDLRSNYRTHAVNLSAGTIISRYATHSTFDTEDAFLNTDGRFDLDARQNLHGAINVAKLHEDPGAPNIPGNVAEPVKYMTYRGTAGVANVPAPLGYAADVSATRGEYEAVPIVGGGILPESDRNNWTYEAKFRGSYEFQPSYQAFAQSSLNYRDYDHAAIGSAIRTSHGFRIDGGIHVDLTGLTFVDAFAGYLQQDYQAASLGTVAGPDVGANIVWNPTQLTSLSLKAERSIQDASSTVVGTAPSPAFFESTARLSIDQELYRNVLVNGHVGFANDDFNGIDRSDNDYTAGAGIKYLLDRHLYLGATYDFEHRDSSGAQAINQFSRNIFMLRISTQL
jgi:hypothetical protein